MSEGHICQCPNGLYNNDYSAGSHFVMIIILEHLSTHCRAFVELFPHTVTQTHNQRYLILGWMDV